jgi:hypothetical protein
MSVWISAGIELDLGIEELADPAAGGEREAGTSIESLSMVTSSPRPERRTLRAPIEVRPFFGVA